MTSEIKVAVFVDHSTEGEANPWSYSIGSGLLKSKGRIGASWDNLNHVEAVELFMIEMALDRTHNFKITGLGKGDDCFAVTVTPKKYTTDYDVEFCVHHDLENPDDITAEMMIEALEDRIEDIKRCNETLEALGQVETFENY
jgi:hypothetical protein